MASSPPPGHQDSSIRFRFKRKHKHTETPTDTYRQTYRQHRSHNSSKRRRLSPPNEDPRSHVDRSDLDPDTAFRESLYDAMGDDEGAQYWQSVYGQPIHHYSNSHQNPVTGELETMTDEEYASFVRRKMWEKSWEGIEAAREEMRRQKTQEKKENHTRQRKNQESDWEDSQNNLDIDFEREIEASLRRGTRRQERQRWKTLWQSYLSAWQNLESLAEERRAADRDQQILLKDHIVWPIESGKREDISPETIERFVNEAVRSSNKDEAVDAPRAVLIKGERVKWHPDKIQQRYGFMGIDDDTMRGATAVFQILDRMWNEIKPRG